ncbi:PadR family transcriptional regulator [Nocardioides marmoribigeumensis]|uniref:DNA-binding PadR family transcriptional regulator n=1 Tax=Nocardioides marmoribigeumensis TaxID=433649 RepID=A0ABU2BUJ6_9ACTN|nr:PadR family transcriptional regulator [Nocardioides marmoribigeumensis]MDR7362307.1 DNA-binding PadR family transcriptional regulator [Nocardioides marmoribigeumensis]
MARRGDTLELAVLGLLHENPLHGYELRKQLNLVLGWGRVLSYGSLYPALKKLSKAGLIVEDVLPPAAPGTVSRRQRITYRLTPAGDERFAKLMSDSGPSTWEDDNFDVRFAFFGRTDRAIRLRVLEGRRSRLEERLSQVRQDLDRSHGRDTYARELKRHGVESVERELVWLSELIAAERGEGRTPTTTDHPTPTE